MESITLFLGPTPKMVCNAMQSLHVKKQLLGQVVVTMNIPFGL